MEEKKKKLANARIEPLDNGFIISGTGLAKDAGAARHVDNNFNCVFPTLDEALKYLNENMARPEDVQELKASIAADRETPPEANTAGSGQLTAPVSH